MSRAGMTIEAPYKSLRALEAAAAVLLADIEPRALREPVAIDWGHVVEHVLPALGIRVAPRRRPVHPVTGVPVEAMLLLDPYSGGPLIIMDARQWAALMRRWDPLRRRAIATLLHELGHILAGHLDLLIGYTRRGIVPDLVPECSVPASLSAEAQAWTVAGLLVLPRRAALAADKHLSPREFAGKLGVSAEFLRRHLERIGLLEAWEAEHARRKWVRPPAPWLAGAAAVGTG